MLAHEGEGSALTGGARRSAPAALLRGPVASVALPVEDEESLAERLRRDGAPDVLVVDAAGLFAVAARPGPGGTRSREPCR